MQLFAWSSAASNDLLYAYAAEAMLCLVTCAAKNFFCTLPMEACGIQDMSTNSLWVGSTRYSKLKQ